MMKHYISKDNSAVYFDDDGFAHTGDIGFYDERGDLHYVDRLKELIK